MFAASKTASVSGGYQISRSLRFNSADSAYLNRTPASASSRTTWTWSGWVKRSSFPATRLGLFNCTYGSTDNTFLVLEFDASNRLAVGLISIYALQTTPVYRDPSAWYHIVLAVDTTQATASNRMKLYVNGTQVTAFDTNNLASVSQNMQLAVNSAQAHGIGEYGYFGGYQTEINFIDGSQLTPSSFGETNAQTGVWQPKAYSGSYGTNGFYLNFSDNSNTTAATLGKDYSGNGNNWTPNNFSVTAGVDNDSMVDVPTPYGVDTGAGGSVRGNYCTINPLDGVGTATITNGNLSFANTSNATFRGTIGITGSSGKWYWEFTQQTAVSSLTPISYGISTLQGTPSHSASARSAYYYTDLLGRTLVVYINGVQTNVSVATAIAINEVLQFAYDSDTGKVWIGKGGVWSDSTGGTTGNPATGANATYTFASVDQPMAPTLDHAGVAYTATLNCGQRAFVNTAPSGFKALCTQNLPTPTIGATTATQAGNYFNTALWTGDNTTNRNIAVGFEPDLVWTKGRNSASWSHFWQDRLRGFVNFIQSPSTAAETTTTPSIVSGTYSSGFTIQNNGNSNNNADTYVAWNWKANGSGSTNTSGSITSTVSANTTSGFSIVTYTGTGANATVGHGLGVAPSMIIIKNRSSALNWICYHVSLGNGNAIYLNLQNAAGSDTAWNNTSPTSTVFSLGSAATNANGSGNALVAYCFADVAGYSKAFSYTGNGATDGPFVYLGFRPAYLLIKGGTVTGAWWLIDCKRSTYNLVDKLLYANLSNAEDTYGTVDLLSNGFKIRQSNTDDNASGYTYIGMAFAEFPFKYSLAR